MRCFALRDEIFSVLHDMTKIEINESDFKYELLKTYGFNRSNIGELISEIEKHFRITLDLTTKEKEDIQTVERLVILVSESLYQKAPWEL